MNRPIRSLAALALTGVLLSGCTLSATSPASSTSATVPAEASGTGSVQEALSANMSAHVVPDATGEEVTVTLADGASSASSDAVSIEGDTVTITAGGTYRLTGELSDGRVVVRAGKDEVVRLVLDGVKLTSSTSAALWAETAGQVVVESADGSTNSLTDTARTVADGSAEPDAALYSKVDLTLTGTGALTVTGKLNDAIASTDGLVIDGGTLDVTAVDDGIRGKDYLVVRSGTVAVTAGGDGLKSDRGDDATAGYVAVLGGALDIEATGDGIVGQTDALLGGGTLHVVSGGGAAAPVGEEDSAKGIKAGTLVVVDGAALDVDAADDALHSDATLAVHAGTLTLASGDDALHADGEALVAGGTTTVTTSYEGLEAPVITVSGGEMSLTASDDGINGAGDGGTYAVTISGGATLIDAGGDGLDANGTIEMSGGSVTIAGPVQDMNGAIDADGTFTISGGELVATGSSGMAMAPDTASPQASLLALLDAWQPAGSTVTVVDTAGATVYGFVAAKEFSSVVLSVPGLVAGETYDVVVDGTVVGSATAGEYQSARMFGGGPSGGAVGGMPGGFPPVGGGRP